MEKAVSRTNKPELERVIDELREMNAQNQTEEERAADKNEYAFDGLTFLFFFGLLLLAAAVVGCIISALLMMGVGG